MAISKSKKIMIFEAVVTFFLVYLNWMTCTSTILLKNSNLIIATLDFALIFTLLFVTSFEYFSTFNPIISFLLYLFKQISWKKVT